MEIHGHQNERARWKIAHYLYECHFDYGRFEKKESCDWKILYRSGKSN